MEGLLRSAVLEETLAEPVAAQLGDLLGAEGAQRFWQQAPRLKQLFLEDVEAALAGDPAAESREEVLSCYPGIYAVQVHRLAHEIWKLGEKRTAREMAERAHSRTGIDIHPGAVIGGGFFIDHGTGVVIGQTARIGRNVRLYHGVTLGALSIREAALLKNVKRHPSVEDDVVIYAGATVLGGETVVGRGSVIGANAFVTVSLPPESRVEACAVVTGGKKYTGRTSEQLGKNSTISNHFDEISGASADQARFPLTNQGKSITL